MKKTKETKAEVEVVDKNFLEEKLDNGFYLTRVILEMVGKPKAHVESTMQDYVSKISKDSRYHITEYSIEKAEETESNKEMFSTFAEIEFLAENSIELMNFVVDYMPSSVEVIEPSSINVQANYFSNLMTELVGRLHMIDDAFKKANAKSQLMSKSLGIMIQNSILILLNLGPRTAEKISETVGVDQEQAKVFLDKLVADKKIKFDSETEKYSLNKK